MWLQISCGQQCGYDRPHRALLPPRSSVPRGSSPHPALLHAGSANWALSCRSSPAQHGQSEGAAMHSAGPWKGSSPGRAAPSSVCATYLLAGDVAFLLGHQTPDQGAGETWCNALTRYTLCWFKFALEFMEEVNLSQHTSPRSGITGLPTASKKPKGSIKTAPWVIQNECGRAHTWLTTHLSGRWTAAQRSGAYVEGNLKSSDVDMLALFNGTTEN